MSFTLRSAWTPQLAQPFSCGKLTACALSPTDAAPTRTAVAPDAVCGPSRYRGCGTFGRSRLFQVSGAPPFPRALPSQSVTAKVTPPPLEVVVSGWPIKKAGMFGLALFQVLLLTEFAESSSPFPQACGWERRVILWEAGLHSNFILQQFLHQYLKWIEAACLNWRISRSCYKVSAAWNLPYSHCVS